MIDSKEIKEVTSITDNSGWNLQSIFRSHFLPPIGLYNYSDCAVLQLEYADLGTLIDALYVLQANFTGEEHEYLAASLTYQVLFFEFQQSHCSNK